MLKSLLLVATSAISSAQLSPYNMTQAICYTKGDHIDVTTCHQRVFDALVQAEVDALTSARGAQVNTDASAAAVAATANALAWAYDSVATTLEKHGKTWKW